MFKHSELAQEQLTFDLSVTGESHLLAGKFINKQAIEWQALQGIVLDMARVEVHARSILIAQTFPEIDVQLNQIANTAQLIRNDFLAKVAELEPRFLEYQGQDARFDDALAASEASLPLEEPELETIAG